MSAELPHVPSAASAHAQEALARNERYYRALLEHALDVVLVVAPDGIVLDLNPAMERVLAHPAGALGSSSLLEVLHPDDRDTTAQLLRQAAHTSSGPMPLAFRARHRDGGWHVFEGVIHPLDPDAGQGLVVNARDITERLAAEETLRTTEARLRQVHKMEAVGRLAGGIAHDFNNVLTAIYGYADLLLDDLPRGDERRADVEEIRRSAERAASLTRQLLAFSRQQVLQPQVLDLNQVVEQVHRMLGRLVGSDIVTTFEPDEALRPVFADRGQIEQVLLNLGANARDAMPEGGTLVIRTSNRTVTPDAARSLPGLVPGDYVTLSVTDSGVGMPESVRRHVFEPFFTTKEQGQGTGLGLATVYGTVKQSGGGIYVDSEEHVGTTFTIFLPPHAPASISAP